MKACVIGAGAWGTAMGMVLAQNGWEVSLWDRDPKLLDDINSTRKAWRLQGVRLPDSVTGCKDPAEALEKAKLVVSAIPSTALTSAPKAFAPIIPQDAILVSATKGLDADTLARPTEAWVARDPSLADRIVAISGPNFAVEIARGLPAATVVASKSPEICKEAQSAFMVSYLRVYTHWDVAGVELGGALKNIIAIACGMAEGISAGYNAQAAIISRGIAEISRLGVAMGADPLTFAGLSGLGDLVLTSTGHLSRNRQAGIAAGRGESIEGFLARTGYTVEGLSTVRSAVKLAKIHGITMPITNVVHKILYENLPVRSGLLEIMSRDRRSEHEGLEKWVSTRAPSA